MENSVDFQSVEVYFVKANMPLLKAIAEVTIDNEVRYISVSVPKEFRAERKENEKIIANLRWSANRKFLVAVGLSKERKNNEAANANLFAKAKQASKAK